MTVEAEADMQNKKTAGLLTNEIEIINRQMSQLLIQQSDIDEKLKILDRRARILQKNLEEIE